MTHFCSQVLESHQAGKLDTSGTAKTVISCFQKLGVSFDMDQVCSRAFKLLSLNLPPVIFRLCYLLFRTPTY